MRFLPICAFLVLLTTTLFSQPVIPPPSQSDEIIIDASPTGSAEPGDRIRYKVQIQNTGSAAATLVQLNAVLDPKDNPCAGII